MIEAPIWIRNYSALFFEMISPRLDIVRWQPSYHHYRRSRAFMCHRFRSFLVLLTRFFRRRALQYQSSLLAEETVGTAKIVQQNNHWCGGQRINLFGTNDSNHIENNIIMRMQPTAPTFKLADSTSTRRPSRQCQHTPN